MVSSEYKIISFFLSSSAFHARTNTLWNAAKYILVHYTHKFLPHVAFPSSTLIHSSVRSAFRIII